MENIRIFLVDDHQLFRDALRSLLERASNIDVVGETGDPSAVLGLVRKTSPDIVCMDINMPGMNGIEVTRRLHAARPQVKVIALSSYTEQRYVADMINAGALAYITKADASDELLRAITAVVQKQTYFSPDVEAVLSVVPNQPAQTVKPGRLGNRERQVLQLVADGLTSAMIASRLEITASTVDVHRRNIMRKLHLHNVADLTRYAISNGIYAS
jgi:DNA-binding NarL/FixJ family response regulator